MTKLPSSIGALHPSANKSNNPPASPLYTKCPIVLNANALRPNPARTIPLAVALYLSEKDFATALRAAVRPAAPPHPERNIEKHKRAMPLVEGSADGLGRMGMYWR